MTISDDTLLELFHDVADAVRGALDGLGGVRGWGLAGTRVGQYRSDLAADAAALERLELAGVGVLSEESGITRPDAEVMVILDPVDGSTNASRGIPWYATSLCAVDGDGPRVALVADQAGGARFTAVRGAGAHRDGTVLRPSGVTVPGDAIVALSALPPAALGWQQFRVMGACALDLCAVAEGMFDGYVDCGVDAHGVWDYAGAMFVCQEAGAAVGDALGRDLLIRTHGDRRTPVAGATPGLLAALIAARATAFAAIPGSS